LTNLEPRLLGGIRRFGGSVGSLGDVARGFGVSNQAASKLIETLVIRGYDERGIDPEEAAGAAGIAQMRETVGALVALRDS
jgi:hypothetical protein